MEWLPNSTQTVYNAVTHCYARRHNTIAAFQGYSDSNLEKSHIFQTDSSLGF